MWVDQCHPNQCLAVCVGVHCTWTHDGELWKLNLSVNTTACLHIDGVRLLFIFCSSSILPQIDALLEE